MHQRARLSGLGVACFLAASTALAQITSASGPEIEVAATATFQSAPAVAPDGAGGVIAVWQKMTTTGGWDIFAQQYKSDIQTARRRT
jgi:hypothetical protein